MCNKINFRVFSQFLVLHRRDMIFNFMLYISNCVIFFAFYFYNPLPMQSAETFNLASPYLTEISKLMARTQVDELTYCLRKCRSVVNPT